jgi:NADH-quinone oxidoreductase subunit M
VFGVDQEECIQLLNFFYLLLLGSVLMLVAIIAIYWITGTTDVTQIYEIKIPKEYQNLLWLAFLVLLL